MAALFWIGAYVLLVTLIVDATIGPNRAWLFGHDPVGLSRQLMHDDRIDVPLILHSLHSKPTFASTFAWWHSSWVPEVPFWRPLTIQTFWIEEHLFSIDRFDRWVWVSCVAHLMAIAAFGWFVYLLTDSCLPSRRVAITWLSLAIYAAARLTYTPTFLSDLFVMVPADVAIDHWKNQPDLFADTFVFATLALVLTRRYALAIGCAFIAVAFKESGWMAWVLAAGILTVRRDWKRVTARIYIASSAAIAILITLRYSAGAAVFFGYHQGTNQWWMVRYQAAVGNCYLQGFTMFPYCSIIAHSLFAFAWLRRRGKILAAYATVAIAIPTALLLQMHMTGDALDVSLVSYVDDRMANFRSLMILGIYLVLSGAAVVIVDATYRRLTVFAVAASLLTALPFAAATQVQTHALHQTYAFQSLAWALMFVALGDRWWSNWKGFRKSKSTADRPPAVSSLPGA